MSGSHHQLSISCPSGIRTNGEIIHGHVQCRVSFADVSSLSVVLRGEIKVADDTNDGAAAQQGLVAKYLQKISILEIEKVLWTPDSVTTNGDSVDGQTFYFSFRLPTTPLPPSFHTGNGRTEGTVQYYIQAKAIRKSWHRRNVRVDFVFPFLPIDRSIPSPIMILLPDWPGHWHSVETTVKVRKTILAAPGLVRVELRMPALPNIPLFIPIPVQIHIVCSSKLLASSTSTAPSKFNFPRVARVTDIDLTLRQQCQLHLAFVDRTLEENLGSQAGFGKPHSDTSLTSQNGWDREVSEERKDPRWIVDPSSSERGRWTEEVAYCSSITFRCTPPFVSHLIQSSNFLDLQVHIPGFGNDVKVCMGPLNITSGLVHPGEGSSNEEPPPFSAHELDLPPSYWFIEPPPDEDDT